jgi:hypothetical protein
MILIGFFDDGLTALPLIEQLIAFLERAIQNGDER